MLRVFSLATYEPLETATLEAISCRTFVLIPLTLDARRGEICTLRHGQFVRPSVDWCFVLLHSVLSFIDKTAKGSLPTEPFYSGHCAL